LRMLIRMLWKPIRSGWRLRTTLTSREWGRGPLGFAIAGRPRRPSPHELTRHLTNNRATFCWPFYFAFRRCMAGLPSRYFQDGRRHTRSFAPRGGRGVRPYMSSFLPDPAGVGSYHFLSRLAAEGLAEFRHVGDHVVDAEFRKGVGIGGDDQARDLLTDIRAPGVGIGEEETLAVGPAVVAFVVERLALLLQREFQSG